MSEPSAPRPEPPAQPRDASTVVVLRDVTGRGIEVYLVKRSRMVDFMAGAHVFPGGRLDKDDSSASACALLSADVAVLRERLGEQLSAVHAAGLFVAAIRETFEEAGLLLGRLAAGWNTDDARRAARRPPPVAMPLVWSDKENGRAYISLPGDPRHPLPDVLGGDIRRFQLVEGRYRAVKAD